MQACGVSLLRLLRPVAIVSLLCWAATSWVMIVSIPNANQRFREIGFRIAAERVESEVRPRVFFNDFPDLVLYVRDVPPGGGWNDVFMADNRGTPTVYLARRGRVLIDRERRTVEVSLEDGASHTSNPSGTYDVAKFDRLILSVNPQSVFPTQGPPRGAREMTIRELQAWASELEGIGDYPHTQLFEIQKKFSIPFACLVFGLVALGLGATNRRDGKLASFVVGVLVILVYYVQLYYGQSLVRGHLIAPWLAAWLPNIVIGGAGLLLLVWRNRSTDRAMGLTMPAAWRKAFNAIRPSAGDSGARQGSGHTSRALTSRYVRILDRYVALSYARIVVLAASALAGVFYLAAFIDLSEKVYRGDATWNMLWGYMLYATPQIIYYVVPLSVLLGALVTIGLLTKNSELIVMKACGISLYRVALPMLVGATLAGGLLFLLEESVLGPSNRQAEALRHVMRGGSPETFDVLNRRWLVGSNGQIYHFEYFNPRLRELNRVSIYEFVPGQQTLSRRTFADRASFTAPNDEGGLWTLEQGWTRSLNENGETLAFTPFTRTQLEIEPIAYFSTQQPDSAFMSYSQLREYTSRLQESGFDVLEQQVALARKLSFPFITLVMTLIAIPFAVTTGRHGALYGIGVGILLAITYWLTISVFAALGIGGAIAPALAAWAPNLLFGAGATYLLLTVRT